MKVPTDLDWANTPIYRQHVLKQSDEEAIQDTEVFKRLIDQIIEERSPQKSKSLALKKAVTKLMMSKKK